MDDLYRLIVGLGNPGSAYENTRHNVGFSVVRAFATKKGFSFKRASHLTAEIASGIALGRKTILLLPLTYMNGSGESVKKAAEYFKVPAENSLMVADDINLPFGILRFRKEGSAGGHNGLKSVEQHLGTQNYPRVRIGVGDRVEGTLEDHVLSPFAQTEREKLSEIIDKACEMLETWLNQG